MFIQDLRKICGNRNLGIYSILIFCICLTLLALFVTSICPTHVQVDGPGGSRQINLPFEEHSYVPGQNGQGANVEPFAVTGNFSVAFLSQHIVHITPDICVISFWINGIDVNTNDLVHGSICDTINGFDIDLGKYLHRGNNTFKIRLAAFISGGDWAALSIKSSYFDKLYLFLMDTLTLAMTMLLYFFLKNHIQLPKYVVLIISLGLLIRIIYLSYTPYSERMYDVLMYGGHLDYIKYVANTWQLPQPQDGWEYYQSPLYYITAAIIYKISNNLALDYQTGLQLLSLAYFMAFLTFGVLILQRLCKSPGLFFASTALLVFWPSGIIHSIRIGNDPMYYMLSAIGMYFLMQWLVDEQSKHFYLASLFTALSITAKLNGVLVLGIFGIFFVSTWLKTRQRRKYLINIVFAISVVLLAAYFSLFRSVETKLQDHHFNMLVGNISEMTSIFSVGNNLRNYVYFDVHTYITEPFTSTWIDAGGRQYFWNFFLKSMLFGEFSFQPAIEGYLATVLSLVLLQMIAFFFIGFIVMLRKVNSAHLLMIVWFVLSLLSLIYYRHTYPFAPDGDFRFIFPAIIPFIYCYISGIDFFRKGQARFILILEYALAYVFVAVTCLFFIVPTGIW
jgi:hypothetical protein